MENDVDTLYEERNHLVDFSFIRVYDQSMRPIQYRLSLSAESNNHSIMFFSCNKSTNGAFSQTNMYIQYSVNSILLHDITSPGLDPNLAATASASRAVRETLISIEGSVPLDV